MSYQVTAAQISQLNPNLSNAQALAAGINAACARYGMDQSQRRMRYFVAQSFFETENYTDWSENLYYSTPERLVEVWPSHFTMDPTHTQYALAQNYVCNPQALANFVYANRDGNGPVSSGDGYEFRGRGAFQLTGRTEYTQYSQAAYGDNRIVLQPQLVALPPDAFLSAGWFWDDNHINALADTDSFTQATKVINGSTATVPQRLPVLDKVNAVLVWP
jgi:putative chitinase